MKKITFISVFIYSLSSVLAQNVGINTTTPNAALDVRSTGNTSATYGVVVSNNTNDTSLVVSDNGNVGIGTTLPVYSLDVQSSNPIAARFSGRVSGQNAVNANEFITLQQAATLNPGGGMAAPTQFSNRSSGTMGATAAIIYCKNLNEGGFTDWRVATVSEFLNMLADDNIPTPSFSNGGHWLKPDQYINASHAYWPFFSVSGNSVTDQYSRVSITDAYQLYFAFCVR